MTDDRTPYDGGFDDASDGSVEGHLAGSRWGRAPERPAGRGL